MEHLIIASRNLTSILFNSDQTSYWDGNINLDRNYISCGRNPTRLTYLMILKPQSSKVYLTIFSQSRRGIFFWLRLPIGSCGKLQRVLTVTATSSDRPGLTPYDLDPTPLLSARKNKIATTNQNTINNTRPPVIASINAMPKNMMKIAKLLPKRNGFMMHDFRFRNGLTKIVVRFIYMDVLCQWLMWELSSAWRSGQTDAVGE